MGSIEDDPNATDIDRKFMKMAIDEADKAHSAGNHPFGAVIVKDGKVLYQDGNHVETDKDVTAHGELYTIRNAYLELGREAIDGSTLYSSCEPCSMCTGAVFWSGIDKVVYGAPEQELDRLCGSHNPWSLDMPCREVLARGRRQVSVVGPLLAREAIDSLQKWTETFNPSSETKEAVEKVLFDRLKSLSISFENHKHAAVFTVEEAQRHCKDLPGGHCKNLFLCAKKDKMFLVVCEDEFQVDLKKLSEKLNAPKLRFGSKERLLERLGVIAGSVTPFAVINDKKCEVTVVLEQSLMEKHKLLNFHPLRNDMTTAIAPDDLLLFLKDVKHEPSILAL